MRWPTAIGFLGGIALMAFVLSGHDLGEIAQTVADGGPGLILVVAIALTVTAIDGVAWQALIPAPHRPPVRTTILYRYICQAVNTLLPVAQVGGEVARMRLATARGVPVEWSVASVITDLPVQLGAQLTFAVVGIAFLSLMLGGLTAAGPLVAGLLFAIFLLVLVTALQRIGLGDRFGRALTKFFKGSLGTAIAAKGALVDQAIRSIHGDKRAVSKAFLWHLAGWPLRAVEVWLVFYLIGEPIGYAEAAILEGLVMVVRSIAFMVPGALGIQEGALVLVGGMLGIPTASVLALALVKRGRELAANLPGLGIWLAIEGRLRSAKKGAAG